MLMLVKKSNSTEGCLYETAVGIWGHRRDYLTQMTFCD